MSKIVWDQPTDRTYETGVDHGVLYLLREGTYKNGVAWNGLTAVSESPSGAEESAFYADNMKYLGLRSAEEFGATIECYTYPDEWAECDGSAELAPGVMLGQQKRSTFGFSYRTKIGNAEMNDDYGYKIHMIYGCTASPSERSYNTVNESPEPLSFSYEITTTPVSIEGYRPTAQVTIDSTKASKEQLKALEDILYGTEDGEPRLPLLEELKTIFAAG